MKSLVLLGFFIFGIFEALADFRAGIAVRTVTPDPLLPVVGGIGAAHVVNKKQGELTVRALAFEEGTNRVVIVSSDFLGFPALLGNKVRAAVNSVSPQNILIGATHTHSAPDTYGFPDKDGKTSADPTYLAMVCSRMADAINEAFAKLQPAQLKIATSEAKGKIAYNYYAEQLYDPRCHVIQALDPAGHPIATLVNYAIHPEVLGCEVGICSPDLIGPLYEEIIAKGGGIGIFMNGAQGGMVTADSRLENGGEARNWDECKRIGTLLADEALRIINDAAVQPSPKLFCAARSISLPVDSPGMRALMKAMPGLTGADTDHVTTQLNVVNLGNAQILTIPGEALPNIGFYLKRKMHGQHNFLFGLTNDAFGYILAKEDFDSFKRYAYVTRTSLGERTCETLEREALSLVDDCPRPAHL